MTTPIWSRNPARELGPVALALLFVLISVFSIATFGINAGSHHFYNLAYIHVFSHAEQFANTPLQIISTSDFNRSLLLTLAPVLKTPLLLILLTLLANSFILFLGFCISRQFFCQRDAFIFITILGIVANSPIYGFVANELVFTRKTLVIVFTLSSILCYLRQRPILGGLCASLSILIHPLNGLSALFFFYPSLMLYQLNLRSTKNILLIAFSLIPVLMTLIYSVAIARGVPGSSEQINFHQWYLLSLVLEADDVAMFWKLLDGGIIFLPTLILAFSFSLSHWLKNRQDTSQRLPLHIFNLVQLPLVATIVLFEALLIVGLEIPRISEWFATIQLRRGIWVPMAIGLLAIYVSIISKPQKGSTQWIIGIGLAAILDHTLIPIVVFIVVLTCTTADQIIRVSGIIALGFCIAFAFLGIHEITPIHTLKHTLLFALTAGTYIAITRIRGPGTAFVCALVIYSSIVVTNSLARNHSLMNSLSLLNGNLSLNENAVAEQRAIMGVNDLPIPEQGMILFAPVSLGYSAQLLSTHPLFLSRWDNMQIFNPRDFVKLKSKLETLSLDTGSCGTKFGSKTGCFLEKAQEAIDELTLDQAASIREQYPISVIVRRTPFKNQRPTKTVGKFLIYVLS